MACSFDHEHMRLSLRLRRLSLMIVGESEFVTLACRVNQRSQSDMHRCSSASMLCAVIGRCAGRRVFEFQLSSGMGLWRSEQGPP